MSFLTDLLNGAVSFGTTALQLNSATSIQEAQILADTTAAATAAAAAESRARSELTLLIGGGFIVGALVVFGRSRS